MASTVLKSIQCVGGAAAALPVGTGRAAQSLLQHSSRTAAVRGGFNVGGAAARWNSKKTSSVLSGWTSAQRSLSLQEYQSKDLLEKYNLNVQPGKEASTPDEVYEIAEKLLKAGAGKVVIKCQILAGGRGKGTLSSGLQGGVKICETAAQAREYSRQMLGYKLMTHQTVGDGEHVNKVLVVNAANIQKELYLAMILDRDARGPVAVVSQMGGVDIEDVAATNPEAIKTRAIDIEAGMSDTDARVIAGYLGFDGNKGNAAMEKEATAQIKQMYDLFIKSDATQVEINPLALVKSPSTGENRLVFIDAKLSFDDFAGYRQKELFALDDKSTMDYREVEAEKSGLNFVGLDGNVGCLVNGAGLAMATMDIIKLNGGSPANFLDVGGGADEDQVTQAFRILKSDPNVKVLFVNIFGGIMRCDIIAQGLVEAAKTVDLRLPVVIRLVGNRVDMGKEIVRKAGFKNMIVVDDFAEAARTVVECTKKA